MQEKSEVLVTGAGGFIGSHLVERLVSENFRVRALVHYRGDGGIGWLKKLTEKYPEQLTVVKGDVRDPGQMLSLVEGVEVVFHLAALIGIPYSFQAPQSYIEVNVLGTQNLLEASKRAGVRAFVQTSTSEVYGTAETVPMSESHRLNPQSPYAASKVAADAICLSYFHSYGFPVTTLRPFNTFGPRQSTRAIIPTIIRQIIENDGVVELGNLEARRDFTFVADTVSGFLKTAAEIESTKGKVLNLGAGWDISIGELVDVCSKAMDIPVQVISSTDRLRPQTSEVERLLSDNSLARELIGWRPEASMRQDFAKRVLETAMWWEKVNPESRESGSERYHL